MATITFDEFAGTSRSASERRRGEVVSFEDFTSKRASADFDDFSSPSVRPSPNSATIERPRTVSFEEFMGGGTDRPVVDPEPRMVEPEGTARFDPVTGFAIGAGKLVREDVAQAMAEKDRLFEQRREATVAASAPIRPVFVAPGYDITAGLPAMPRSDHRTPLQDVAVGIPRGIAKGVGKAVQAGESVGRAIGEFIAGGPNPYLTETPDDRFQEATRKIDATIAPPRTVGGQIVEGITQGFTEVYPLVTTLGAAGVAGRVGQAVGRAAEAAGAGTGVARVGAGVASASAGAAEIGAAAGAMEAARTGDAGAIGRGVMMLPDAIGRFTRGEQTLDDYINVGLSVVGAALGARGYQARPTSALAVPEVAPKGSTTSTAKTGLSPEAVQWAEAIPSSQIDQTIARLRRSGPGGQALIDALETRKSGRPIPRPVETPPAASEAVVPAVTPPPQERAITPPAAPPVQPPVTTAASAKPAVAPAPAAELALTPKRQETHEDGRPVLTFGSLDEAEAFASNVALWPAMAKRRQEMGLWDMEIVKPLGEGGEAVVTWRKVGRSFAKPNQPASATSLPASQLPSQSFATPSGDAQAVQEPAALQGKQAARNASRGDVVTLEEFRQAQQVEPIIAAKGDSAGRTTAQSGKAIDTAGMLTREPTPDAPQLVQSYPVAEIVADPKRFQFKLGTNTAGAGTALRGVKRYDPNLAGVLTVWRDAADGKTYVVNGHHRLDLARRHGVPNVDVRFIAAESAAQARAIGALINIAEGRGTAIDAAKFIRDTGITPDQLSRQGIDLSESKAADGVSLANLTPELFADVVRGKITPTRGAIIGKLDHAGQKALMQALGKRTGEVNDDAIAEMVRMVRQAPTVQVEQGTLFGNSIEGVNTFVAKAELTAWLRKTLGREARLFKFVSQAERAKILAETQVGTIDTGAAGRRAQDSAVASFIFDKLAGSRGPISDIINRAAEQITKGGNVAQIRQEAINGIRSALQAIDRKGEGGHVQAAPASGGEGRVESPQAATGVIARAAAANPAEEVTKAALGKTSGQQLGEHSEGASTSVEAVGHQQTPKDKEAGDLFPPSKPSDFIGDFIRDETGAFPIAQVANSIGRTIFHTVTAPVSAIGSVGKWVIDLWAKPLIRRVEDQGKHVGKHIATLARKAVDASHRYQGDLSLRAADVQKASGGASRRSRRAVRELQEIEWNASNLPDVDYGFSVFQSAVEARHNRPLHPLARRIVEGYRKLVLRTGRMAEQLGMKIYDSKADAWMPFQKTPGGERLLRSATYELHDILRAGLGNPAYNALAQVLADANGIPQPVALAQLNTIRHRSIIKRAPFEILRVFDRFPTHMRIAGQVIPLLHSDPYSATTSLVKNSALRLGFVKVFGQDIDGSISKPMIDHFVERGGKRVEADNLFRALHGMPIDEAAGRLVHPGTAAYEGMRTMRMLLGLYRSALLTMSALPNMPEPLAKTPAMAGIGRWLRAWFRLVRSPRTAAVETARIGARTVNVMNVMTQPGANREAVSRIARELGLRATGSIPVNELNELHAAVAGMVLAGDLKKGRGRSLDRVRLELLDFSKPEIESLMKGTASDELYQAVASRFAGWTQGSTETEAEMSRKANSRLASTLIAFDRYGQFTMDRVGRVNRTLFDALKHARTDPKRAMAAAAVAAQFYFGHAAAGAGAMLLVALAVGGPTALWLKLTEAKDDPAAFVAEAAKYALLSGPADAAFRMFAGENESAWDPAVRMMLPLSAINELRLMFTEQGRYRDQSLDERVLTFLRSSVPITKAVKTTAIMLGLDERDQARDVAIREYWKFRVRKLGKPAVGDAKEEEHIAMRRAIRRATEAMKQGDDPAPHIIDALGGGKDSESIAASLRGKMLLPDLMKGGDLALVDELRAKIGDEMFDRLTTWDALLDAWADAVHTPKKRKAKR